ncbi:MAG TPA: CotH kinase family protein [Verrucomicrobiae bacterium]|nr:CotH kinase family protein [Verrucomicrobiae bacterium]
MKAFKFPTSFIPFVCFCIVLSLSARAADKQPKVKKKEKESSALFSEKELTRISIEIGPADMEKLLKYQWQFGPRTERESVQAIVREGEKTYKDVSLHLKGAAGSFRPASDNPAMTLNFDKFVDGQNFHGLTKLSLNNSVQDPTLVSEQFCRELFLKAGVAVPRATHAVVELNGRDLGVYVLVEGFNKQFLKRHFKNSDGNLYDGGFVKDVNQELSVNSGENPKDQSDRIALAEAASEPDLAKRKERLEKNLDLDRFLTYIALDVMLWDWDGYAQNKNNWRLFHDRTTGKMVFIPHGLDQILWKPEGPIFPPFQGMVAKAVLQIPELRKRYVDKIKELRTTVFTPESMTNRVNEIAAKVGPLLRDKYSDQAKEQEKAVSSFCDAIVRRARSIDDQLSTPIVPFKFDENGKALLAHWEPKTNFGKPIISRETQSDKTALHVTTKTGSSIGTWRSKVWLEPGTYKIEGQVKTKGIVPDIGDTRGGAGLRLANQRSENYLTETSDWKTVSREFTVDDPISDVQILCEFRGAQGEAWFENLQLSRVPEKKK